MLTDRVILKYLRNISVKGEEHIQMEKLWMDLEFHRKNCKLAREEGEERKQDLASILEKESSTYKVDNFLRYLKSFPA